MKIWSVAAVACLLCGCSEPLDFKAVRCDEVDAVINHRDRALAFNAKNVFSIPDGIKSYLQTAERTFVEGGLDVKFPPVAVSVRQIAAICAEHKDAYLRDVLKGYIWTIGSRALPPNANGVTLR